MAAAGAGHARRADLALVADRATQRREVLVVDDVDLLPAERAGLEAPATGRALAAAIPRLRSRVCVPPRCFATYDSCVLATSGSERNVVVRAAPGGHRRLGEVRGIRGNVALRREATAVLATLAGAEELHGVGNDIYRLPLLCRFLVLPLAPLEAAVDRDGPALREVLGAVLALRAPDGDVEVVGLVDPLAGRLVLPARVAWRCAGCTPRCRRSCARSSGSRVRFPVRTTRLMFVAAMRLLSSCPARRSSIETTYGFGALGRPTPRKEH